MIEFNNVKKTFKRTEVLKGLNLKIEKGDRIALVGSNGAGKTTMIRCLLGEYVCEGQVLVNGHDPRHERQLVLKDIGFVPQLPPPLKMPVGQLIHFSASLCNSDPKQMINVVERLGLDFVELKSRPFVKLSGGQKQKILISIALGRDAKILILDEPAANLDPDARHIFFQLLAENKDAVMLISSHRLDEVAALVNRVIEMDQGLVVLDDRVEDEVDLDSILHTEIKIKRVDEAFAKAINLWNFESGDGTHWRGQVAGPDRLRFLGVLSRYAAILKDIHMEEKTGD
ncbi:MAG: ABC transporter ATP-binding protein [gamma proteobacterium symbiont of Taylorina sp.]|nr:ABC transporter ATP-binding protein [gamma proteobacterium symbiont of Taylorina sp.]